MRKYTNITNEDKAEYTGVKNKIKIRVHKNNDYHWEN